MKGILEFLNSAPGQRYGGAGLRAQVQRHPREYHARNLARAAHHIGAQVGILRRRERVRNDLLQYLTGFVKRVLADVPRLRRSAGKLAQFRSRHAGRFHQVGNDLQQARGEHIRPLLQFQSERPARGYVLRDHVPRPLQRYLARLVQLQGGILAEDSRQQALGLVRRD